MLPEIVSNNSVNYIPVLRGTIPETTYLLLEENEVAQNMILI